MEFVCWLGLLGAGLPECETKAPDPRALRAAKIRADPWLSKREKGEKIVDLFGPDVTFARLEGFLCRYCITSEGSYWEWQYPVIAHGVNSRNLLVWVLPDALLRSPQDDPNFAPTLTQSLAIRATDLPPREKGRRIARLITPWMNWKQVQALFGESEATFLDLTGGQIVYLDYGITYDLHRSVALPTKVGVKVKTAVWDCVERETEEAEEPVFDFYIGFTR